MKIRIAAVGAACTLLLAACGSAPAAKPAAAGKASAAPQRIVSMSPTATEMLFAIGAGKQVVAVDDQSNYPAGVPKTKLSAYQPSAEAIAKFDPDLVIIADDSKGIAAQLKKLSIPVATEPAAKTLDDTYRQINDLGAKTGHGAKAASLVTSIRSKISELTKDLPTGSKPLTYYHELDNTLYSATSKTFIGQLYGLAGLKDIADPADAAGGGYPQLSAEYLVKADPDLVFLADTKCCRQTAATFAARPGFGKLKAVREGHVVPLDDDVASRWGPRVVDLLKRIVEVVKAVRTG